MRSASIRLNVILSKWNKLSCMPVLSLTNVAPSFANLSVARSYNAVEFRYQYMVINRRNGTFTAREDLMAGLDELRKESTTTHVRIAICGLGGVGYVSIDFPNWPI